MRVLVVASPLTGHVLPVVPLAQALHEAGHEVVVATAGDALAAVPPSLATADVAPGLRTLPLFLRLAARHPLLARGAAAGTSDVRMVGLMFGTVGLRMADGVAALADRLGPDLVVVEPLAPAGAEAAARLGVPLVLVEGNLFPADELLAATARTYVPARGTGSLPDPAEVLGTTPPSLVGRRSGRPMRFVPATPDRPYDPALARPGDRPRVLVSRSTVADPRPDRLMTTAATAAAAATRLDVVLVRPDRRVARRKLPPNVRTTDWLPFPTVLPAAAGIVHHGGAGTLLTALAAGVPQVAVRGAGDRRVNAELVAERGAGLAADLGELTGPVLERLVADPSLSAAAREVAAEIAAMPCPAELVPHLVELAGARHG
ncbi:glycosyltransferase [Geodermatophilus sp. CPCC 206100]|uniref:glycosyltransferase n=1 Tax=Geodermatophilus sp. CPCC 206100 TaxID=3020054 RepID=UPI003B00A3EA